MVTVGEFEEMELPDSREWELIDGTIVSSDPPDIEHGDIQARLYDMLRGQLGPNAVVRVEYGYALGPHTRFCADVADVDVEHRSEGGPRTSPLPRTGVYLFPSYLPSKKTDPRCNEGGRHVVRRAGCM